MNKKIFIISAVLGLLLVLGACADRSPDRQGDPASDPSGGVSSEASAVWKLSIAQPPEKLEYEEGETFDPAGVVINAKMKDGSILENVAYEGIIVDQPLTRTSLFAKFVYGGETVQQNIKVTLKGNREEYSVASTQGIADSPLAGKVIFWLGSSVSEGASSGQESMADFLAKKHGAQCIKEAVSGTTLADRANSSYVSRLDQYLASDERAGHVDAFICQLSTNDKGFPDGFGAVTPADVRDAAAFDTATTFGAMEYIIATAKDTWDCPVYFYTNPPMDDENYETMVQALEELAEKWGVTIIDLYRDQAFNDISEEEQALYMADSIHPTKAGYREWWLPKFEEALSGI